MWWVRPNAVWHYDVNIVSYQRKLHYITHSSLSLLSPAMGSAARTLRCDLLDKSSNRFGRFGIAYEWEKNVKTGTTTPSNGWQVLAIGGDV